MPPEYSTVSPVPKRSISLSEYHTRPFQPHPLAKIYSTPYRSQTPLQLALFLSLFLPTTLINPLLYPPCGGSSGGTTYHHPPQRLLIKHWHRHPRVVHDRQVQRAPRADVARADEQGVGRIVSAGRAGYRGPVGVVVGPGDDVGGW